MLYRLRNLLLMGALLVLGACPVAGQVDAPEAEEIFQRVAQQVDKQPVELRHAGRELRRDPSAGCPELQAGWALELFAEGLGQAGSDLSECLAEVQQCSTTYTRLHWYAGFLLYRQGKFAEALVQMDHALGDDLVRAEALDARGGLHALLGDYGAAVTDFTALMNLDPEAAPFSVYVNLSGIQLVMGEWEEAIRWTEKGLEKVQKKRAEISPSSPEFAQLSEVVQALLSNQLASATRKGDATLAYATWRKMGLVDLEQTKLSNLESVLDFALTDDRFQIYEYIKEEGRQRWAKLPDREWQGLGVSNLLLNPHWEDHFVYEPVSVAPVDSLLRRWNVVRALYFQSGGATWQEEGDGLGERFGVHELGWLFLALTVVLLLLSGWRWWRQMHVHRELKRPRHSIDDFIEAFTAVRRGRNFHFLLEELNAFLGMRRKGIQWSGLNAGETEVLLAIIAGKGSKEIAQLTNRSPASVYNMRSSIRRKLKIPEGVELESWCAEMNGVG